MVRLARLKCAAQLPMGPIRSLYKRHTSTSTLGVNTDDLRKRAANYAALSPLVWLERAAKTFGSRVAIVDKETRRTWRETRDRAVRLCDALRLAGLGRNDVVQVMLDNSPEMIECHFGVPMCGCTLGCINTRLDSKTVAFILQHSEAKALVYDERYESVIEDAKKILGDASVRLEAKVTQGTDNEYEMLLSTGSADSEWQLPEDEWDAIALNYTSGAFCSQTQTT